ncbi:MAG TPA: ABC transporter permease subunit [Desulfobacterales bacterium]|nr:ABC transporter permease subunit [Desulfobacterales bacterium]
MTWACVTAVSLAILLLQDSITWLDKYPDAWVLPINVWINTAMDWFVRNFKGLFHIIAWLMDVPMQGLAGLLQWLPWPATVAIITILAHTASGWRLALFTCIALMYMVVTGYWDESMNTLALVGLSVPLSVAMGFIIGLIGFRFHATRRVIQPTLDVMQTVPTFAYLIPILMLFGFGPVVGLVASAIYAMPPMVRNIILGLDRVPADIVDAGRISGSTDRQLLWWVQIPSAMPTIMMGVNQTIMAALSMVIIAAVIGGFGDIGWEVLSTMRRAQFGQSLLAGFVIALMAMIMDRISMGFASRSGEILRHKPRQFWRRYPNLLTAFAVGLFLILFAQIVQALNEYPRDWIIFPANELNKAVEYVTVNYYHITNAIKNSVLYFFMIPLRIGLEKVASPRTWGFAMNFQATVVYWSLVGALALAAFKILSWRAMIGVLFAGVVFLHGTTGTPWPIIILAFAFLAAEVGGWRLGLFTCLGLFFILVSGVWHKAMLSIYLSSAAVLVCFVVGGLLGVWASLNDRVSAFLRPINDTLQTMPLFVFLIPVIMIFLVGEFPALLAIVAYAIVPAIRYTEHGLRHVDQGVVEAAQSFGCTSRQLLFEVKLPLALPEIMLGLNQTIMFALAMLVIAALVGTTGLGQAVFSSLTHADMGMGVISGGSIAILAMIGDRITQAWSARKKEALGLQ